MEKKADRRRTRRVAVFEAFQVLDTQTGELLGYLRDISPKGMMVVGTSALVTERAYELVIVLPEPIANVYQLQIEATCRWHTFDARRGFHESGFQFGELASHDKHLVEQIQGDYEFSVDEREL